MQTIDVGKIMLDEFDVTPRFVCESDAEFILSLRQNPLLNKHLSPTDSNLQAQIEWIRGYKNRERQGEEFYFIFENANNEKFGVGRLYHLTENSFTGGSWLFKPNSPSFLPILADIFGRDYGFYTLNKDINFFDVRKQNKKVLRYQKMLNPTMVNEDDIDIYFSISKSVYEKSRQKILKMFL